MIILKILHAPILLAVMLVERLGIFVSNFSSIIFNLFTSFCSILAAFSYLAGICTGSKALRTLIICFAAFLLPMLAGWMLTSIGAVHARLSSLIHR